VSDEHLTLLESSADAFARIRRAQPISVRVAPFVFECDAWRDIAEQGWLSTLVPESAGGLGLGVLPMTVVARALGRAAERSPVAAVGAVAVPCLAEADDPVCARAVLDAVAEGSRVATVAWQNERGDIDHLRPSVSAQGEGASVRLLGTSRFVAAPSADLFIVGACESVGLALYMIPRDAAGLTIVAERCADGSELALLTLDRVRGDAGTRLVGPDRAPGVLRRAIDAGLIATAAELVGVMDAVLEMTLEYLRTRRQFDVPIGSFQALHHRAVDIWMQREIAAAAVTAAGRRFDDPNTPEDDRSAAASGAKSRAASAAMLLCNQALQLHGAMGFTEEYGLGLYLNRALTLSAWLGNAVQHRGRFAVLSPLPGLGEV
jgi:alkylation response protein AidB-like acyl-CoA dehydrogenase